MGRRSGPRRIGRLVLELGAQLLGAAREDARIGAHGREQAAPLDASPGQSLVAGQEAGRLAGSLDPGNRVVVDRTIAGLPWSPR